MSDHQNYYSLSWSEKRDVAIKDNIRKRRLRKRNIKQTLREELHPILSKYPDLYERTTFMLGVLDDVSFKSGVRLEVQYRNIFLMAIVHALGSFPPVTMLSPPDWRKIISILYVKPRRWRFSLKWQQDLPEPVAVGRDFLDIYIPTNTKTLQLELGIFYGASSEFKNFKGMKRRGLEIAAAAARTIAVDKVKEDIRTTPVGGTSDLGLPGGGGKCPYDTYPVNDLCRRLGGPLDIRRSFYKRYNVLRDLDPYSLAAPHNLRKALQGNYKRYLA